LDFISWAYISTWVGNDPHAMGGSIKASTATALAFKNSHFSRLPAKNVALVKGQGLA
jgi:hypothetical protein